MDAELADLHLEQLSLSERIHALRASMAMGENTQEALATERGRLAVLFIHETTALHRQHWNAHLIDYLETENGIRI